MGVQDYTLYDMLNRSALCFRDRPAWKEFGRNETYTFGHLKDRVDALAAGLQKGGVRRGDRIAVIGKNSWEYALLCNAAAALGAVLVPLNWRLSPEELHYCLADCEPVILFCGGNFQDTVDGLGPDLPSIREYVCLDGEQKEGFSEFDRLMDAEALFSPPELSSDDAFLIIYTAAIAGRPRGAVLSHLNVLLACSSFSSYVNLGPGDVHLSLLPFFHVAGLFSALMALQEGAVTLNMEQFKAGDAASLIEREGVTFLFEFSPILSQLLEHQEKAGSELGSLRAVAGLDDPETIVKFQDRTGGDFFSVYGQTEVSGFSTLCRYNECPGSSGRMLPFVNVRIVDDRGRPVEPGQTGEIVTRGPLVFKGYWKGGGKEEPRAGGWHHTGDLGRFDEDGFLWYAGRKAEKELIKPGGENVYPAEVEKVILEHPAVERVVVFGVPDSKWREGIKAVCQLKQGRGIGAQELIDFVGARIARYKKPGFVEFVDEIPVVEDGSPDREAVKALHGGTSL